MTYIAGAFFIISLVAAAGCSGAHSALPQAFGSLGSSAGTTGSWMSPAAKTRVLLYVTGGEDVDVFTWPELQTAGVLKGFQQTTGACVDAASDVWIADAYAQKLYEYAHGGTTPIATLDDTASFPNGCTINKRDGDLAVGNEYNAGVDQGSITVYQHASGPGTIYYDSGIDDVYSLDYAPDGNLFLEGWTGYAIVVQKFVRRQFETIPIKRVTMYFSGGVQYWKDELTVAGATISDQDTTIYRINESGKLLGKTLLKQAHQSYQYQIFHGEVILPCYGDRDLQIYPYPRSGNPRKTRSKFKGIAPWAAVVSPAVKQ